MSYVTLWVASSDSYSERRFGKDLTILDLKNKLELITGISCHLQLLTLERTHVLAGHGGHHSGPGPEETLATLSEDSRTLESYGVKDWTTLRVTNTDPYAKGKEGQWTDMTGLERFELTKEEYESRSDTVLAYKQRHKLGRFAPPSPSSPSTSSLPPAPTPLPPDLVIGARCEVSLSSESDLQRRGTVRFIGKTEFGKGKDVESIWIGVEYDEPLGKGDGMIEGKRYFQTLPMRATFIKPDKVKVGDFPELDPFAEEAEDEDMEM